MKGLKYPLAPLAILLVGCIVAYYFMREPTAPNGDSTSKELQPVDASALDSAVTLAALAATPDEQVQARDAWRLADQELDLHFAAAMRDAQTEVSQLSVPAGQALEKRILQLQAEVDADKKRVDDLAKDTTGELARAQTQLVLDQDQLDATREELERTIAPRQTYLQHLIQLHQIYDQKGLQALKFGTLPLVGSADEQFQAWLSLGGYMGQVNTARQQANQRIVSMNAERGTIQRQLSTLSGGSYLVATLRQMANFQKKLSGLGAC